MAASLSLTVLARWSFSTTAREVLAVFLKRGSVTSIGWPCLSTRTRSTVALTPLAPISMPPWRLVCCAEAGADQPARILSANRNGRAGVGTRVVGRMDTILAGEQ